MISCQGAQYITPYLRYTQSQVSFAVTFGMEVMSTSLEMILIKLSYPIQGYYPNVNPTQLAAAKEVLQQILSENLYFNTDEEWEFLKILRFLRARNFEVRIGVVQIAMNCLNSISNYG